MKVKDIIQPLNFTLGQQEATSLIDYPGLIGFINLALCDIYSYEGRFWSFTLSDKVEINIPSDHTDTTFTYTHDKPIVRIQYIKDNSDRVTEFVFKKSSIDIQEGDIYFAPQTNTITFYNNNLAGYKINIIQGFNFLSDINDELPIPEIFSGALHSLTLGYAFSPFGQTADSKENNAYSKGINQLINLSKLDGMQISGVKSNIK